MDTFLPRVFITLLFFYFICPSCTPFNGEMPDVGSCSGPTQRAEIKLEYVKDFNSNCNANQVQYYKDNDPNSPQCGDCVPGTSGIEDPEIICGLNQFCNDTGSCQNILESPLYNEPCPYEQGGPTSEGWCGPGLRCIHHVCLICENGILDPTDGKYCNNNEWTYSQWKKKSSDPEVILLIIIIILMVVWMWISSCVYRDETGVHVLPYIWLKKVISKIKNKD